MSNQSIPLHRQKPPPTGGAATRFLKGTARRLLPQAGYYKTKKAVRAAMCQTGALRVKPDFIVIGAQKSGSSSLFYYLQQHPDVIMPLNITKEVHYFDEHYTRGMRWYRGHFPVAPLFHISQKLSSYQLIAGEATPEYLVHPRSPMRVANDLPDVRCIAVLRNPIDRAYSQYKMEVKRTAEKRSFEEAMQPELENGPMDLDSMTDEELASWHNGLNVAYLTRGIYVEQLERWKSALPDGNLHITLAEDLFGNTEEAYAEVMDFLGIRPFGEAKLDNVNQGGYNKNIDPSFRQRLEDFYAPYNQALQELLGRQIDWQ